MTLLIPFTVGRPLQRLPWVTTVLLVLCGIGFGLGKLFGEERVFREWGFTPGSFDVVTLVTSLFLHAGWLHLLGNALYLYLFCACVEDLLGRVRFMVFYFSGGGLAALAEGLLQPNLAGVPMIGASGAISACLGCAAILLPKVAVEVRLFYLSELLFFRGNIRKFSVPLWVLTLAWFAEDVYGLFHPGAGDGNATAFGAHVAGFAFGLLAGWAARRWCPDCQAQSETFTPLPNEPPGDPFVVPESHGQNCPEETNMHRLLGFVVGAVLGLAVAMFLLELNSLGGLALCAVTGGVATAILAGRSRQRFWSSLGNWFRD